MTLCQFAECISSVVLNKSHADHYSSSDSYVFLHFLSHLLIFYQMVWLSQLFSSLYEILRFQPKLHMSFFCHGHTLDYIALIATPVNSSFHSQDFSNQ